MELGRVRKETLGPKGEGMNWLERWRTTEGGRESWDELEPEPEPGPGPGPG